MSSHWTSSPCYYVERSVRELNPVFLLTTQVCCRNTYRPFSVLSDPGWTRTSTQLHVTQASSPLDHGINQVIEVVANCTKSPGSRPDRFASSAYSTVLLNPQVASPGIEPGDRPYESQLSTNWPASSFSREEESRTPTPRGHDVLSVAPTNLRSVPANSTTSR